MFRQNRFLCRFTDTIYGFAVLLICHGLAFAQSDLPLSKQGSDACVDTRQFLSGEYLEGSKSCDPKLDLAMEFCALPGVTEQQRVSLYSESFIGEFFVPFPVEDLVQRLHLVDAMRTKILLQETLDADYDALLFLLYSDLYSELIGELADSVNQDSFDFSGAALRAQFFPFEVGVSRNLWPKTERKLECLWKCGSSTFSAEKLTRSEVFNECLHR